MGCLIKKTNSIIYKNKIYSGVIIKSTLFNSFEILTNIALTKILRFKLLYSKIKLIYRMF